jgi:hypothetical protein
MTNRPESDTAVKPVGVLRKLSISDSVTKTASGEATRVRLFGKNIPIYHPRVCERASLPPPQTAAPDLLRSISAVSTSEPRSHLAPRTVGEKCMKDFVVTAIICLAASAAWPIWLDEPHPASTESIVVDHRPHPLAVQVVPEPARAVQATPVQVSSVDYLNDR